MLPLLNEFRDKLLRDGRQPNTIQNALKACVYFAGWHESEDFRKVGPKDIDRYKIYLMTEYISHEGKKLCNETVVHRLSALSAYFKFLLFNKKVLFDPTINLKFPKKIKRLPSYIPTEKDVEELINKPDTYTYVGIRDRLLFELSYTCPLRNSELQGLNVGDIDMKDRYIYPARAKGGRECGIPIIDSTHQALQKYFVISRPRLLKNAKAATDRLFITRDGDPFKPGTINEIFQKYRGDKHIHPHSMRHACAVHMIRNGAGLRDVQVLLGHRSLKSTVTYTVLTANDLKDLHVRYHPREKYARKHELIPT